jgi:predicted outer membrane repeat protein
MFRFLKLYFGANKSARPSRRNRPCFRPTLEAFEDRVVPSTLTVYRTGDSGAMGTLRWAVNQADNDASHGTSDTIQFASGMQDRTITLSSPLELTRAANKTWVTITGSGGPSSINLSGAFAHQVFLVDSGANLDLQNLTIEYGKATYGGAVMNYGLLDASNCVFIGNTASYGGAICNLGILAVTSSTLDYNVARQQGGAIYNSGTVDARYDKLNSNTAASGGAIANRGILSLDASQLDYNRASGGGALYNGNFASVSNTSFVENYAKYGGAIYDDGSLFTSSNYFADNKATARGGAFFVTAYGTENFHSDMTDSFIGNYDPYGSGDGYFA